jgi:hypothetical protein
MRISIRVALGALAAMLAVSGLAIAAGGKSHKVRCTYKLHSTAAAGATTGEGFGTISCSPGPGKGLHHHTFHVSGTTVTATFQDFYERGSLRGTVRATFSGMPNDPNVTYTGTFKVTGGTGAYRGASGGGKITGSSADGGAHDTFVDTGTVKY